MGSMARKTLFLVAFLALPLVSLGQYKTTPDWISSDKHYATGGAFADINNDGWLDFVVSNGNDMLKEKVTVYYNAGGVLQSSPGWQSADAKYHGHLAIGDVNQDGWLDVAVAVLVAQGGPGVKLYLNQGGVLSSTPSWSSSNSFYGWHVALGDPDSDGDLDLLIGSSDAYGGQKWKNFIYFNVGGSLQTTPGWQSNDNNHLDHMEFCDVDDDGDQDVVAIGSWTYNFIYRNNGGVLSTIPDWQSTDNGSQFANTLAVGDVTGDGKPDMVMSDNNQLGGGTGKFKLYRNLGNGYFEQTPGWSYYVGYVSGLALADVNADGMLDFAGGAWWNKIRIFLNNGSGFNTTPSWISSNSLVVEAICFGDLNRDGLVTKQERKDIYTGKTVTYWDASPFLQIRNTPRKLFYLDHQPIEKILKVVVDGKTLSQTEYCANLLNGWISLKNAPSRSVLIEYVYSTKLDMGVTDWDNGGNLVYYHL